MPFAITCPHCGSRLTAKSDKVVGKQMPCPKCKEIFTVEQSEANQSTQSEESDGLDLGSVDLADFDGVPAGAAQSSDPFLNSIPNSYAAAAAPKPPNRSASPSGSGVFANANRKAGGASLGSNRTLLLAALIGGGGAFLLLLMCGVGGWMLLSLKGGSNSEANQQATAEANSESAAATTATAKSEDDEKKKAQSLNNLKQIALAFHNYHDTYKTFPPAVQIGLKGVPHSWRVTILPFMDGSTVFDRYRQDEPWDSEHNKTLLSDMPAAFRAPDAPQNSPNTSYFGFAPTKSSDEQQGKFTVVLGGTSPASFRDIPDGTTNTVLVVESKLDVPWTQPADLPFDFGQPLPVIGGIHSGGFCAAMCDGSAIFIPDSYDRDMLLNLIHRQDGKAVVLPGAVEKALAAAEEKRKREEQIRQRQQELANSKDPVDRRKASFDNLRHIGIAIHNYHDTYKAMPAAIQVGPGEVPRSWRVTILPYLRQGDLHARYHQDEPWDSPHNKTLLAEMPEVYRAPGTALTSTNAGYFGFTLTSPTEPERTPMPALAGSRNTRFASITDGLANSLLVVESKLNVPWTQPADIPFDMGKPLPAMGGIRDGGFNAAMCDGLVVFFPDSFDRSMLLKIILRSDGEPVELPAADR